MTHRLPPRLSDRLAAAVLAAFSWADLRASDLLILLGGIAMILAFAFACSSPSYAHSANTCGLASWYGSAHHGNRTASGEKFDMDEMTAAHPYHLFGTILRVTRPDTGASALVRVNDRGPYIEGRIIDLSRAAAAELRMIRQGLATVCLEVVERPA